MTFWLLAPLTFLMPISLVLLRAEYEPPDLQLIADEQLIFQILVNLIKNAIRAMEGTDDPSLSLRNYRKDQHIMIEVSDNGCGIPADIMDFIFIPFFSTLKDGSGIGLSLSRQIMNAHNGSIFPVSKPGEGTTFQLQF